MAALLGLIETNHERSPNYSVLLVVKKSYIHLMTHRKVLFLNCNLDLDKGNNRDTGAHQARANTVWAIWDVLFYATESSISLFHYIRSERPKKNQFQFLRCSSSNLSSLSFLPWWSWLCRMHDSFLFYTILNSTHGEFVKKSRSRHNAWIDFTSDGVGRLLKTVLLNWKDDVQRSSSHNL